MFSQVFKFNLNYKTSRANCLELFVILFSNLSFLSSPKIFEFSFLFKSFLFPIEKIKIKYVRNLVGENTYKSTLVIILLSNSLSFSHFFPFYTFKITNRTTFHLILFGLFYFIFNLVPFYLIFLKPSFFLEIIYLIIFFFIFHSFSFPNYNLLYCSKDDGYLSEGSQEP